jgi:hypothetical protein
VAEFYATQEGLNSAVRIAAATPGLYREVDSGQIVELYSMFGQACKRALPLLANLPYEKADATLKKTIESFAR